MSALHLTTKDGQDASGVLRELFFRTLLGLVLSHTGGEGFLGDDLPLATDIYRKSLVGRSFPSFWIEVPLLGDVGFDLHVYYDRGQVRAGERFEQGSGFGMQALFDWFFGREAGGVGIGFAHDLRARGADAKTRPDAVPTGAYVNFNRRPLLDMPGFFAALGADEKAEDAMGLIERLPTAWRPWYLGLFPGRLGAGTRIGAFVERGRRRSYACHVDEFVQDLARAGFAALNGSMLGCLRELAALPYQLELQLDAVEDGVGSTLGVDITLSSGASVLRRDDFADGVTPHAPVGSWKRGVPPTGAGTALRMRSCLV